MDSIPERSKYHHYTELATCKFCGKLFWRQPSKKQSCCSFRCRNNSRATSIVDRFWTNIDKSGGADACWEWQGSLNLGGYGQIAQANPGKSEHLRPLLTHRFAFEITYGLILPGFFVCHHCDNRKCCNPKHLFLGLSKDNHADMVRKGRQASTLRPEQVAQIKELDAKGELSRKEIAKQFGTTYTHVWRIVTGRCWTNVP